MKLTIAALLALFNFAALSQRTHLNTISATGDGEIESLNLTIGQFVGSINTSVSGESRDFFYIEPIEKFTSEPLSQTRMEVFSNSISYTIQCKVVDTKNEVTYQLQNADGKILVDSTLESDTYNSIFLKEFESGTYVLTIKNGEAINEYRVVKN